MSREFITMMFFVTVGDYNKEEVLLGFKTTAPDVLSTIS